MTSTDKPPLIILPGAMGSAEMSSPLTMGAGTRATHLIQYTPQDTLERLIARVLDAARGSETFDLLGQSYGGWIAQCVTRKYSERVRRLVVSHSFKLVAGDAWRFRVGLWLLPKLPRSWAEPLLLKRLGKALAPVRAKTPEEYERLMSLVKDQVRSGRFFPIAIAQQKCLLESLGPPMVDLPPVAARIPVLIIESDNDPILNAEARAALKQSIQHAEVHCFSGTGHVSALVDPDGFSRLVQKFLG